jgi:hypothetical protein
MSEGEVAPRRTSGPLLACAALWFAAVGAGMAVMIDFAAAPGDPGRPSPSWPAGTRIVPVRGRPTLVMAAHPRCPCTRASMAELASIMARCQGRLETFVLFLKPAGAPGDWSDTDLWRDAAAIPEVSVVLDEDGEEARRFGVRTSGHTLLYGDDGRLVFSGGITSSRGMQGDNAGRDAIVSWLETGRAARADSPIFGCSLRDSREVLERERAPWIR